MACYIPIEDRYNCRSLRNRQMHHVWAATAAAVVTTGVAVYGAVESSQSAKKAAGQASKAGKEQQKSQQQALERFRSQTASIAVPQWNLARDIKEAGQVTDYNVDQLEKIFPGAKNQREIAARATESYLRGEIPQDVQESIMRSVAELGGAGFAPAPGMLPRGTQVGGFQAAQGLLSRQLGLTSLDLQQTGMSASQSWQSIAGAFIESPLQVGQARLGFEKAAADIQMQKAAAEAGMAVGASQAAYGTQMQTIGANLAARQAQIQGIQGIGSAISGGLQAYGQAKAAQNASQLGGGTYGSVAATQEASPYATGATRVGAGMYAPRAQAVNPAIEAKYSIYK
jgi:hypothetical protein